MFCAREVMRELHSREKNTFVDNASSGIVGLTGYSEVLRDKKMVSYCRCMCAASSRNLVVELPQISLEPRAISTKYRF